MALKMTVESSIGGRNYMEDRHVCQEVGEATFIGMFDGHGGIEAAEYVQKNLVDNIVKQEGYGSKNDDAVLNAIKLGFVATHDAISKEQPKWPKTDGYGNQSGTTASVVLIKSGKLYVGHVGDSRIVLGSMEDVAKPWTAMPLTTDHKPGDDAEMKRIIRDGGKVAAGKNNVLRVVYRRPRLGNRGRVLRMVDEIPFLALSRSLGDLWSYNADTQKYVVSEIPDVKSIKIDTDKFRCIVVATDGLWDVMSNTEAINHVYDADVNAKNPSKYLIEKALALAKGKRTADNISVYVIMLNKFVPSALPAVGLSGRTERRKAIDKLKTDYTNEPVEYVDELLMSEATVGNFEWDKGFSGKDEIECFHSEVAFWQKLLPKFECSPNVRVSRLFWGNYFGVETPKVRKDNPDVAKNLITSEDSFRKEISRLWKAIPSTHSDRYAILLIASQVRDEVTAINGKTKHAAAFVARLSENNEVKYYYYETIPFNPYAPMGFVAKMSKMSRSKLVHVIFPQKTMSPLCFYEVVTFVANVVAGKFNFDCELPAYNLTGPKGASQPLRLDNSGC